MTGKETITLTVVLGGEPWLRRCNTELVIFSRHYVVLPGHIIAEITKGLTQFKKTGLTDCIQWKPLNTGTRETCRSVLIKSANLREYILVIDQV